jgi:hypothetical protein
LTVALVALLAVILPTLAPQSAVALPALSWSAPFPIDRNAAPPERSLHGVACLSTSECVAVDSQGRELTFNPGSPGTPQPVTIDHGEVLLAVACPSASQCTAVDLGGNEVTFDPANPGNATPVPVASGPLHAIACISVEECVAIGHSSEVTFNPVTKVAKEFTKIDPENKADLGEVACPEAFQCITVDSFGKAFSFNPAEPAGASSFTLSALPLFAIACASNSQCTIGTAVGQVITIDPASKDEVTVTAVEVDNVGEDDLEAIQCPAFNQCTAADDSGHEVTFDPQKPKLATAVATAGENGVRGLSCPSVTQCTINREAVEEVTFNPQSPGTPMPASIDSGQFMSGVACPSALQCTAVDDVGQEVTFDPASPGAPTPSAIVKETFLAAVACPTTSQCTAVAGNGQEVTFNPTVPGTPTPAGVDPGNSLTGVACPSATQCTAVDENGREVTFNPAGPGSPTPVTVDSAFGLNAVACPTTVECVAVDGGGQEVTFNPMSPGSPVPVAIDTGNLLFGVACPAVAQCTAIDDARAQVTFNPLSPAGKPLAIGAGTAIACPSASECLVADISDLVVEGEPSNPASWAPQPLPGTRTPTAIACASATACVVVDEVGDAVASSIRPAGGSPTPLPTRPLSIRVPRISGLSQSHRVWREGSRLARISAAHKPPVGTTFKLTLDSAATLHLTFTQRVTGRRVKHKCVAQTHANRQDRACSRTLTKGAITLTGHAGVNRISFQGRLSHSRKLALGTYTVTITAANSAGHSAGQHLTFTIVR